MSYKTNITKNNRDQIKSRLDDFATFKWRGQDAFDVCGAFIIAENRGDLKFYNGPSFSNEYTKPQFSSSSGNLTGINFNRQQISFKIGAYWFSIEEWQDFIEWINAYEVNYLTFTHSPNYGYLVKLAKIADSPRYIVGHEDGQPRYYTEMELTWDLQGENCVRSNLPCEWNIGVDSNIIPGGSIKFDLNENGPTTSSRLETPLLLSFPVSYEDLTGSISFYVSYNNSNPVNLFSVKLNNLPYNTTTPNTYSYIPTFQYDSETGVLLYTFGDTNWKLVQLNLVDDEGNYIVKDIYTTKYKLKGDIGQYKFYLKLDGLSLIEESATLQIYERTNVI